MGCAQRGAAFLSLPFVLLGRIGRVLRKAGPTAFRGGPDLPLGDRLFEIAGGVVDDLERHEGGQVQGWRMKLPPRSGGGAGVR